jgi:hypothetical protein
VKPRRISGTKGKDAGGQRKLREETENSISIKLFSKNIITL